MNAVVQAVPSVGQPYANGLKAGRLMFQRCAQCQNAWMPARGECPRCLAPDFRWVEASGDAKLVSWVVYHRAFSESFKDRVPYIVAVVQLNEGPRLISNIVDADTSTFKIDMALGLQVDQEGDIFIPRFRVV